MCKSYLGRADHQSVVSRSGKALLPYEIVEIAQSIYPESRLTARQRANGTRSVIPVEWEGCHDKFRQDTYNFIINNIVKTMADQRLARGIPLADTVETAEEYEDMLVSTDRELSFGKADDSCRGSGVEQCQQGIRGSVEVLFGKLSDPIPPCQD